MLLSTVGTSLEIIKTIKDLCISFTKDDSNKKVEELLLRNYYSEIYYNKEVLETINLNSGLDKEKLVSIKLIAPLLKNDYGKTVVASFGFLSNQIDEINEEALIVSEDKLDKNEKRRSLKHNIVFITSRIEVFKNLALLENDSCLKQIKVATRLRNIKNSTVQVCSDFRSSFENVMSQIYV